MTSSGGGGGGGWGGGGVGGMQTPRSLYFFAKSGGLSVPQVYCCCAVPVNREL